jgi:hypothetical protein
MEVVEVDADRVELVGRAVRVLAGATEIPHRASRSRKSKSYEAVWVIDLILSI